MKSAPMTRDPKFDVLFEPVKIGPVTAPNRFYQVPHCTGMGFAMPATLAAMREVKAEGGWGVVNSEYCSIDPSSDDMPAPYASLWDSTDTRIMSAIVAAIHRHGALAGVELWHGGLRSSNLASREFSFAPQSLPATGDPWQCAAMDGDDIRGYRHWHRAAAGRAREAGFDIVYVYAAHTYLLAQFLDPSINRRTDAYGGATLDNRARLLREVLAETREAIGQNRALALRIEVDNEDGSGREERTALLKSLAPLVDLFDVTVADYTQEMGVSRFVKEASLEEHIAHVRTITGKPVVSVGRFTSPETMVSQIRRGVIDLIGAARPSIADPFLPLKIREGRLDDIRECIGCNICYAGDGRGVPIRCTQNPTMGEEWRRGWHPERVPLARSRETVLVVGAGPAGLDAALTLGRRGYAVLLAEAADTLGGRVSREAALPGLAEWARVRDWRIGQLNRLANVEVFRGSRMTAQDVLDTGARHVFIATGARWRADGRGRHHVLPVESFADRRTLTPDQVMDGKRPQGPVVVFDDDHYYLASVIAELLARDGLAVTYVTTEGKVSAWSEYTAEQARAQKRLIELGVAILTNIAVSGLKPDLAALSCVFSGRNQDIACAGFIPVTSREPDCGLWTELQGKGLATLRRIGDCRAPGLIAHAVHDGHRAARELEEPAELIAVRRERAVV
jgi:dimethylamine/trimethylamine dehydrogenase